jgi:hypothetical protein
VTRGRAIEYSAQELEWLEANCTLVGPELARQFNETFGRDISQDNLRNYCQRRGWKTGRTGCFAKGCIPPNKGRKGMPSHPNAVATQFKKGQMPSTFRGHGHEYIDNKDGYVWLIVEDDAPRPRSTPNRRTRSVLKHRYLWEQANGPIPPGHVLKCLTGDKSNCEPSNWRLIPQALLPRLAGRWGLGYDQAPDELKPVLLQTALVDHAAREARRRIGKETPQQRWHRLKRASR